MKRKLAVNQMVLAFALLPAPQAIQQAKGWKVVVWSKNTNKFGLRNFIFVSEKGECAEAAANHLNAPEYMQEGKQINIVGKFEDWATRHSFELPNYKQMDADQKVEGIKLYNKL